MTKDCVADAVLIGMLDYIQDNSSPKAALAKTAGFFRPMKSVPPK
jgi:hypothetical protein